MSHSSHQQISRSVYGPSAEWQSCVIGLLLFSIAFGLLGTILCTCGVCVESIYMKMYYYHSAAEVYFICGMFFFGVAV